MKRKHHCFGAKKTRTFQFSAENQNGPWSGAQLCKLGGIVPVLLDPVKISGQMIDQKEGRVDLNDRLQLRGIKFGDSIVRRLKEFCIED